MAHIEELQRISPSLSTAFLQIGTLELSLRNLIPNNLSNLSNDLRSDDWPNHLALDFRSTEVLARAKLKDSQHPEEYLPFSFWRFLFSKRNYGSLWVPTLHKCFPKLENPKSFNSFKDVDHAMDSTLRLRNNIAHYQISKLANMQFTVNRVSWLLDLLSIN